MLLENYKELSDYGVAIDLIDVVLPQKVIILNNF